jgi:hypothetical protein
MINNKSLSVKAFKDKGLQVRKKSLLPIFILYLFFNLKKAR